MKSAAEIMRVYQEALDKEETYPKEAFIDFPILASTLANSLRPNSASVYDGMFGDSGKGSVAAKLNRFFNKDNNLYALGPNGSVNTGHETLFRGEKYVFHQLLTAVLEAGSTSILSRGKLIHPEDLIYEIQRTEQQLGSALPGNIILDERAPLALDTHRAMEGFYNENTEGGKGATGNGVAFGYASIYQRTALTVKELLDDRTWEKVFREHYQFMVKLMQGWDRDLSKVLVKTLDKSNGGQRFLGTEGEFISRLAVVREELRKYVSSDVYFLLNEAWRDPKTPFIIEAAQAPGLDPFHGVYPDVTASRPLTRLIGDSTYGIIQPENIALKAGVMKIYVSSVGKRRLPTLMDEEEQGLIRKENYEFGKSTGRARGIVEVSLPILQYLKRADGYQYLVVTHLDSSRPDRPVRVITHYTQRDENGEDTGVEVPYMPYQDHLDNCVPHGVEFQGWDGELVKNAKSPKDFPPELMSYLDFLSNTVAPVALGTTGADVADYVSWVRGIE